METDCICRFCQRPCKNQNSLRNHERLCKLNPEFDERRLEIMRRSMAKCNEERRKNESLIWNKGKTKETDERVMNSSLKLKGRTSFMKGKHFQKPYDNSKGLSGGLRKGAGRGKKGRYKGIWCDSSWELAYLIYCLENDKKIERCTEYFEYVFENKTHKYFPDFIVDGTYVEIKGFDTAKVKAKIEQFPKDKEYRILYEADLSPAFAYVKTKYGKNFIDLYEH